MQTAIASGRVRSALVGVLGGTMICVALSAVSARADFFDDLFGPEQRVVGPPARSSVPQRAPRRHEWRVRILHVAPQFHHHETPRKPRLANIGRDAGDHGYQTATGSRPVKPAFCARESEKMSGFNQLLHDSTLRSGDIVAMSTGLRMFHGGGACPHKARDFVAVGGAGFGRGRLRMLAGLEVAGPSHGGDQRR